MTGNFDPGYIEPLTERESEVLQMLADGASNKDIATALVIEVSTVKSHNNQIYSKLQVKNRQQAVLRAQALGLLAIDVATPSHHAHNLPADIMPFIGRRQEIDDILQLFSDDTIRFITILGPGGMGKTRLAIEIGHRLLGHFLDGVYFVPLASVNSVDKLITSIADVIGLTFHGDVPPKQQLLKALQNQQLLLIIDNFEHLLAYRELLKDVLNVAPKVELLVTSREKLGLLGEMAYALDGLSLRTDSDKGDSEKRKDMDDAAQLFIEAARRTTSSVDPSDMSFVTRICQLLGGMPLAILLAAGWLDSLTLAQIEKEIQGGLSILDAPQSLLTQRHENIETVFDYSWQRLTAIEQDVFMRLSVFQDGFTVDAAKAVANASIHNLQRLVHKSFIQHQSSGRFSIHELMRQYGHDKLSATGDLDAACEQHALYFADFIAPLSKAAYQAEVRDLVAAAHDDFENLRATWLFQAKHKNISEMRRLLDGLWRYIDIYSRSQEGIELLEPVLEALPYDNENQRLFRGQLLARLAWFYSDTGQHQKALALDEQALAIVESLESTDDILFVYQGLFWVLRFLNRYADSNMYAKKGFELIETQPESRWWLAFQLNMVGVDLSRNHYDDALRRLELLPETTLGAAISVSILFRRGDYAQAEELLLDSLSRHSYHRIGQLNAYRKLADIARQLGDNERAWRYVYQGLQYGDDRSYAWGTIDLLIAAMDLLINEEVYTTATELLAFILNHPSSTGEARDEASVHKSLLQDKLVADEFEAAWLRGKQFDLADMITIITEQ
ncbi:MAG: hypothetical protein CL607_18065 [Anaerolineaceae bacterium]|nr:hypothetical protein [Anaerolineaceae bacterium]